MLGKKIYWEKFSSLPATTDFKKTKKLSHLLLCCDLGVWNSLPSVTFTPKKKRCTHLRLIKEKLVSVTDAGQLAISTCIWHVPYSLWGRVWVKLFLMATLGKRAESSWTTRMSIWEQKETSSRISWGHDCRSFFSEGALTKRVPVQQTSQQEGRDCEVTLMEWHNIKHK